jgi:endoglucanase Acf2
MWRIEFILAVALVGVGICRAQEIVPCGAGSYASFTPWEKAKTIDHPEKGDQSLFMQERPIYVVKGKEGVAKPTNDWWTRALVEKWTGDLWAYPGCVRGEAKGVKVSFPREWNRDGTEMDAASFVMCGAADFAPVVARVEDWHDWDVEFVLEDDVTARRMRATLAHGVPFTWIEYKGLVGTLQAAGGEVDVERVGSGAAMIVKVGKDLYGVWYPEGTVIAGDVAKGWTLKFPKADGWMVVGLLPERGSFEEMASFATACVRSTRMDWVYDEEGSSVTTTFHVEAEDLRGKGGAAQVLQGFLPHHLNGTMPQFETVGNLSWATPRGKLEVAKGNDLKIVQTFPGLVPYWAMIPKGRAAVLSRLVKTYAEKGTFGKDTYWGGKGLLQMAFAMMAARELEDGESYQKARQKLRETLEDWLTWDVGEEEFYFSYVPRWGGLVGENTSYDSETFNDHHFHYGYFIYAGALLCLEDEEFKEKYGPMLTLIAKDYACWERGETRFPFMRTFDLWAGHSFAGGLGSERGNGQESSSEAMQSWGALYLLGVALGDKEMRDAGIFGWVTEARGTAEYWFDRGRRNIDYTKFHHPYNSNLTCHGVGWWTYFSGDPVWMHAIQWLPNTPMLDYLSEDKKFAAWDYETMWKTKQISGWEGELGDASLGNVLLSYLQRSHPEEAARIFAALAKDKRGVVENADTAHMTEWAIESHLAYGDLDWTVRATEAGARAYRKADGTRTYVVYNAGKVPRKVRFFDGEGKSVYEMVAAAKGLTVSGQEGKKKELEFHYQGRPKKGTGAKRGEKPKARLARLRFIPEDTLAIVGEVRQILLEAVDQFGRAFPIDKVRVEVSDLENAEYEKGKFAAMNAGRYTITAEMGKKKAVATIEAVEEDEVNLARLAVVTASSEENAGLAAANAVDGNLRTRWGSAHQDGEWIQLDFGQKRNVSSLIVRWESAAAKECRVEGSSDGKTWKTLVARHRVKSPSLDEITWPRQALRFVRLTGLERMTTYGISILELEAH